MLMASAAHQHLAVCLAQADPLLGIMLRLAFEELVVGLVGAEHLVAAIIEDEVSVLGEHCKNCMAFAVFIKENCDQ